MRPTLKNNKYIKFLCEFHKKKLKSDINKYFLSVPSLKYRN